MLQRVDHTATQATVRLASRADLAGLPAWQSAFANERKDRRYYELAEDTLPDGFTYRYLVIASGDVVRAIQPCFVLDQDLLAGMGGLATRIVGGIRQLWPRFLFARTLMVGCVAGEGHLDGDEETERLTAAALARELPRIARDLRCALVVMKEFPAKYRAPLAMFRNAGFARAPSMPMTTLALDYATFDDYLKTVSSRTRGKLRRKLRKTDREAPITMDVVGDITPFVDEVYPLYKAVFDRSPMQFEKLTKEFLCEAGRRMPDKVKFFLWRQDGRIIAFGLFTLQGEAICHDYVGFDYAVAFKLNLYYRVFHDVIDWALANGCKRFYSGSLNYDPKWHLRQSLYPIDLYVRHTSDAVNAVFRRILPLMEPTRSDPILPNFENYRALWE
jgi:hypothetical protein